MSGKDTDTTTTPRELSTLLLAPLSSPAPCGGQEESISASCVAPLAWLCTLLARRREGERKAPLGLALSAHASAGTLWGVVLEHSSLLHFIRPSPAALPPPLDIQRAV